MKKFITMFSWRYLVSLVYMLQSTEYQLGPYFKWLWRADNFSNVAKRRELKITKPAKLLLLSGVVIVALQLLIAFALLAYGSNLGIALGFVLIFTYPLIVAVLLTIPVFFGRVLIIKPKEKRLIKKSAEIFHGFKGQIIAIAGSYGKTTMKELLLTVLSEAKKVEATPGNKNVAISHAYFAKRINGDEDILIVEFGEGQPGDVEEFTKTVEPDFAFITGLAPAHLDKYKTLEAAAEDILSLANFLPDTKVYVNNHIKDNFYSGNALRYSELGVGNWSVSDVECKIDGISFKASNNNKSLIVKSGLLGRHQIGPLVAAIDIADKLGLNLEQIKSGISKTKPFEHRMQPYQLSGAWIIDDTYNGNLEGMRAGLELLKELPASRKYYVTPGLVEQGELTATVHEELGSLIANSGVDVVVLMQNSVTDFIKKGLLKKQFKGEIRIEPDPLKFYSNLDQYVVSGDIVLMQNDWTDNYA